MSSMPLSVTVVLVGINIGSSRHVNMVDSATSFAAKSSDMADCARLSAGRMAFCRYA